jgi:hypothetical protein
MSARCSPVGWTRAKLVRETLVLRAVALELRAYRGSGRPAWGRAHPSTGGPLAIRASGNCAPPLLTLAPAVGPLARLDRRFFPLLSNRRHLGGITAFEVGGRAMQALGWRFAYSPLPAWGAVLVPEKTLGQARGFPFIPFGRAALAILAVLAGTSHDF